MFKVIKKLLRQCLGGNSLETLSLRARTFLVRLPVAQSSPGVFLSPVVLYCACSAWKGCQSECGELVCCSTIIITKPLCLGACQIR